MPEIIQSEKDAAKFDAELGNAVLKSYVEQDPEYFMQDGTVYRNLTLTEKEIDETKKRVKTMKESIGPQAEHFLYTVPQKLLTIIEFSIMNQGLQKGVNITDEEWDEVVDMTIRRDYPELMIMA